VQISLDINDKKQQGQHMLLYISPISVTWACFPVVLWLEKLWDAKSCVFSTDNCKFPTEEIWMLIFSIFAPISSRNETFSALSLAFLKEMFCNMKKNFQQAEI